MRALVALVLLGAAPPDGFAGFWQDFRGAVVMGDAKSIAGATRTPFLFEGKSLDAGEFEAAAPRLFDKAIRACFRTATPVTEGDQRLLFCRGTIFVFARDGGQWRFTEIGVDD